MNQGPGSSVIVIGGGVIGALCAWNLSAAGLRVTIVDREEYGSGCSHANCGFISPSHILPLAQPGAIAKTMRAMLKRNSPFSIKPRFSRSFLSWFWNFSRRCNRADMMAAGEGRHALLQSSKRLYQQLVNDEGFDCEWQENGLLFVFDQAKDFRAYEKTDTLLRENFGVEATAYDGQQLTELEPAIKPGFGGAWHYEGDCHLRPDKLLAELRRKLEARGVSFIEGFHVERFARENGVAKAIFGGEPAGTEQSLEADHFVVATGAMTPFLNDHLGMSIPIEPGKGYSITMPTPDCMPRIPIIFEDSHVAVTPMKSCYRLGSTMEFVGYDRSIHAKRLALLKTAAKKYLVEPVCEPVEEAWFGWRPMTWDGKPIIDRSPAMRNVWIAAGHNMLGLSMAPGTGRLVTELILGEEPHIDASHFSASRFGLK